MATLSQGSRIGPFPYRILRALDSHGGMSQVYLATDGPADDPRATRIILKIARVHAEQGTFFENTIYNEAERLRNLHHRGIVRILPIKMDGDMRAVTYAAKTRLPDSPWFLVLEYLNGGSLDQLIDKRGKLDAATALEVVRIVAETLQFLHDQNQVHLDLKPENILFRRPVADGPPLEPVLIDFGVARAVGQEGMEARTLPYAPPERVAVYKQNQPPETLSKPHPSMDVYSLGVVLYQLLTGKRPFEGRSSKKLSSAIMEGNPTLPSRYISTLPKAVDDLVLAAMARDPAARPTAGEMARRIALVMRENSLSVRAADAAGRAGKRRSRKHATAPHSGAKPTGVRRPGVALTIAGVVTALMLGATLWGRSAPAGGWMDGVAGWAGSMASWAGGLFAGDAQGAEDGGAPQVVVLDTAAMAAIPSPTPTETLEPTPTPTRREKSTVAVIAPTDTPTETPSPTASPTPSATPSPTETRVKSTAAPTLTFTPTDTPAPTATPTPRPTATRTPNPTATPIATPTATRTPTPRAKSTLVVTPTPTPSATPTQTPRATVTPTRPPPTPTPAAQTAVQTVAPAPTAPPAQAAAPPPAQPAATGGPTRVTLLGPASETTVRGRATFAWQPDQPLAPGQLFELCLRYQHESGESACRGIGSASAESQREGDLSFMPEGDYRWGIRLLAGPGGPVLRFLGGDNLIYVRSPEAAQSDDDDDEPAEPPDDDETWYP